MRDESAQENVQVDDALWEELPLDKTGLSRRALSRLLTIILAGLVVITTGVIVTSGIARLPIPFLEAASSPTTLPLPPGWQHAGPGFGDAVVFAPQAPTTLYTCAGVHHHVMLGVSHDSGGYWQTATLSMPGDDCLAYSDPYDSHELAIEVDSGCTYNCNWQLYRSFDAGRQWQQAFMPDYSVGFANLVWTKSSLFALSNDAGAIMPQATRTTQASNLMARSRDHGPFSWVALPIANDIASQALTLFSISGAIDNTVYAQYQQLAPTLFVYLQSSDDGMTWHPVAFAAPFHPDAAQPDTLGIDPLVHALIIKSPESARLSYDGGSTWQSPMTLPPILSGYLQPSRELLVAPNGARFTFYTYHGLDDVRILYSDSAGSAGSAWQQRYRGYAITVRTLTWDAQGHPVALWGTDSNDHLVRLNVASL